MLNRSALLLFIHYAGLRIKIMKNKRYENKQTKKEVNEKQFKVLVVNEEAKGVSEYCRKYMKSGET